MDAAEGSETVRATWGQWPVVLFKDVVCQGFPVDKVSLDAEPKNILVKDPFLRFFFKSTTAICRGFHWMVGRSLAIVVIKSCPVRFTRNLLLFVRICLLPVMVVIFSHVQTQGAIFASNELVTGTNPCDTSGKCKKSV